MMTPLCVSIYRFYYIGNGEGCQCVPCGFHDGRAGAKKGIRMEILWNDCKTFSSALKGSLSVICLSDKADGVVIRGLKYEYVGSLTSDFTLGVSNSFIGQNAMVSVEDGTLLLVYERV